MSQLSDNWDRANVPLSHPRSHISEKQANMDEEVKIYLKYTAIIDIIVNEIIYYTA